MSVSYTHLRGGHPAEKEEADDLQQIKDSGELVVLTLYSSNTTSSPLSFLCCRSSASSFSAGCPPRHPAMQHNHNSKISGTGELIMDDLCLAKENLSLIHILRCQHKVDAFCLGYLGKTFGCGAYVFHGSLYTLFRVCLLYTSRCV